MRARVEALQLDTQPEHVRRVHRQQATYFRNHAHRMDYPAYVANDWQIGSGPVESVCKTVVGNRLQGGGMPWGRAGANAVCHLRATYPQRSRPLELPLAAKPPNNATYKSDAQTKRQLRSPAATGIEVPRWPRENRTSG